jgi:putative phosphoribosyl transferase
VVLGEATSRGARMNEERAGDVVVAGGAKLVGDLSVVPTARAVVVFAALASSGRRSAETQWLAEQLRRRVKVGTLIFDLLTPEEEGGEGDTGQLRFQVPLLAARVSAATDWALARDDTRHLPIAYFGIGIGAAAALVAASGRSEVRAVVSRSGRPDLAGAALESVQSPTLLLVGEDEDALHTSNRSARSRLKDSQLARISRGDGRAALDSQELEDVARQASEFLRAHLGA